MGLGFILILYDVIWIDIELGVKNELLDEVSKILF